MREAGLEVAFDAAGNVAGRLRGSEPDLPEVWSGSHLDTPPDGGRFDGALGTLLALDAAEAMRADGPPRRSVVALAFRLEEGPRFGVGCFGSRALCGALEDGEGDLLDADGISLAEAFAALGYGELPTAGWLEPAPACFVEAHIEQGPALAAAGAPLGIVTSIAAMAGFELTFTGRRGHAGTVPMALRSDALGAAAHFVVAAHDIARSLPGAVATIGRLTVAPGATNTIPDRCQLFADLRAPDGERLDALVDGVLAAAGARRGRRPTARSRSSSAGAPRRRRCIRCPRAALERAVSGARRRARRAAVGRGSRRADPRGRGRAERDALRAQRRGRREPRARGAHRRRRGRPRRPGARGRAARAGCRVIDWDALARPTLRGLVRYDPGQSRDSLRRAPPPRRARAAALERGSLRAAARTCSRRPRPRSSTPRSTRSASSPTSARGSPLARRARRVPDAGARRAGADLVGRAGLHRPGHAGRRPEPDLRPLRSGLGRRRAASSRACPPPGSRSTSTPSPRPPSPSDARLVWICDPNNPTGTLIARTAWSAFLDRLPADCIVVADETYIDFADPGMRVRPRAGRPRRAPGDRHPLVLEDLRPRRPAPRLRRSRLPRSRGCSTSCRSRSTSTARRSPPASPRVTAAALRRGSPCARRRRARAAHGRARAPRVPRASRRSRTSCSSSSAVDDVAVCDELMRRGILVRGGTEFGLPGLVRVTVAPAAVMLPDGRCNRRLGRCR